MEKEETIPTSAVLVGGGCALIPLGLAAFVMITVFNWLSSCGELPPPTPEEQARIDVENAREERARLAFETQQKVLWARPAASLTRDAVVREVIKCQEQIEKAHPSPYAWRYEWDGGEALREAKEYFSLTKCS